MVIIVIFFYLLHLASFILLANRANYILKITSNIKYFSYAAGVVLSLFVILSFIGRRSENVFFAFITPASYILMGVWALTISFSILNEFINVIVIPFKIKNFRYYSTLITACVCVTASLWSLINCAFIQRIKEVDIKVSMPAAAAAATPVDAAVAAAIADADNFKIDEFKIVQLSDIHIGTGTKPTSVQKIFERASAQNPDIIVLTGDIIDINILQNDSYLNYGFEKLKAKYGVFAVTGNHDHYTGADVFYELMNRFDIKVLRDDSILLENMINIAGINDVSFRSEEMINIALAGVDKNLPVLFLSHRPEPFDFAAACAEANNFSLVQLSGHTHGGQIPPVEIARRFFMKYNLGIYREKNSAMYVTSGTRWWGPPMRFGNFCEIAVITLRK